MVFYKNFYKINKKLFNFFLKIKNIFKKNYFNILYSLGIDSNINLIILKTLLLKEKIKLFHINHNKNNLDKNIKNFIKKFFKNLKIKIFILNLKKKYIKKSSIESFLKIEREKLLLKIIKKNKFKIIINSKNKNDIIENFYLKIKNFKKLNNFKKHTIDYINKKNIKILSIKNKLKWLEDKTNLKLKFKRNIFRIKFIKRDVAEWLKALPC